MTTITVDIGTDGDEWDVQVRTTRKNTNAAEALMERAIRDGIVRGMDTVSEEVEKDGKART